MKSLKERLKEKAIRLAREEAKLSSNVKKIRVSIPMNGYPYAIKQSDKDYIKERAQILLTDIKQYCSPEFYQELKLAIKEDEKEQKRCVKNRVKYCTLQNNNMGIWDWYPTALPQPL